MTANHFTLSDASEISARAIYRRPACALAGKTTRRRWRVAVGICGRSVAGRWARPRSWRNEKRRPRRRVQAASRGSRSARPPDRGTGGRPYVLVCLRQRLPLYPRSAISAPLLPVLRRPRCSARLRPGRRKLGQPWMRRPRPRHVRCASQESAATPAATQAVGLEAITAAVISKLVANGAISPPPPDAAATAADTEPNAAAAGSETGLGADDSAFDGSAGGQKWATRRGQQRKLAPPAATTSAAGDSVDAEGQVWTGRSRPAHSWASSPLVRNPCGSGG